MSLSTAFAQTTLMLRDLLLAALRADPGWALTGTPATVTLRPFADGEIAGTARLNVALAAARPSRAAGRILPRPLDPTGARAASMFELDYCITAESDASLHVELLLGCALRALDENPVLVPIAAPDDDDAFDAAIRAARGLDIAQPPRLMLAVPREAMPQSALLVTVTPVVALASLPG